MESVTFIKGAKVLVEDVKHFADSYLDQDAEQVQGMALQRRINELFAGLYNPTLPSAFKLRDVSLNAGFFVDPKALNALAQFDSPRGR